MFWLKASSKVARLIMERKQEDYFGEKALFSFHPYAEIALRCSTPLSVIACKISRHFRSANKK